MKVTQKKMYILMQDFLRANRFLRSALSIAKRKGADTNWEAFTKGLEKELKKEHETLIRWYTHLEVERINNKQR